MISQVTNRIHKVLLTLVSLVVLLHSVSLYSLSSSNHEEMDAVEMTEDVEHQEIVVEAFEALIPSFHCMAPLALYFLNNVVLLSEAEYQERQMPDIYEHRYLDILFPLIISPNAP
jgi:hypothetical protein